MSKRRDDRLLLKDILLSIEDIQTFVSGYSYETFLTDKKTVAAVVRNLEIIGEASRVLSETARQAMPQVPWHKIKGMRNRVIHEYFDISHEIIWYVIENELAPLQQAISQYIGQGEQS